MQSVRVSGYAVVNGSEGPMDGWIFDLEIKGDTANGGYGTSPMEMIPEKSQEFAQVIVDYLTARLHEKGATSVVWTDVSVTQPSQTTLYEGVITPVV